jgi:hypothetical protein
MICYLLTWDRLKNTTGERRQEILDFLDTIPEIVNWRATTGIILLVSELTADEIIDKLHEKFPKLGFIVAPVNIDDVQGIANKETWDFIRYPKSAND